MFFGDVASLRAWQNDPRIELHGPGYSKVYIGEDKIEEWEKYLDVMAGSIADNSGRSCINASGIWVPKYSREIAEALAQRLARIQPRAAEDPEAQLAPFADPGVARRISQMIDQELSEPGAEDVTARYRPSGAQRCIEWSGCTYLLPTVLHCANREHALANREFLFPFASVVEVKEAGVPEAFGPSLVLTAITDDPRLIRRLTESQHIGRLNLGPMNTLHIRWDQPHEGNLFDHLYARRAFQSVEMATA
jgi:acyl-CoA reductase-like NAD-dependent aldehyde dehydrogenase